MESLALHKTRRASDLTTRSVAMHEIQEALGLDEAPLRIESYDVSNLQGTHVVASMVVFEDGMARKSEYRRFAIKGFDGIRRRGGHPRGHQPPVPPLPGRAGRRPGGPDGDEIGVPESRRKFSYPPNLVVIDGGPAQVAAAVRALDELGVVDVAVCGLAKRLEEVWLPGEDGPVILPRSSEGLYLLQRVRDEAHRFAITYHRAKRAAALTSQRARRRAGPWPGPPGYAAQAVRLGAQAGRRVGGADRGDAGIRPGHRRGRLCALHPGNGGGRRAARRGRRRGRSTGADDNRGAEHER